LINITEIETLIISRFSGSEIHSPYFTTQEKYNNQVPGRSNYLPTTFLIVPNGWLCKFTGQQPETGSCTFYS